MPEPSENSLVDPVKAGANLPFNQVGSQEAKDEVIRQEAAAGVLAGLDPKKFAEAVQDDQSGHAMIEERKSIAEQIDRERSLVNPKKKKWGTEGKTKVYGKPDPIGGTVTCYDGVNCR